MNKLKRYESVFIQFLPINDRPSTYLESYKIGVPVLLVEEPVKNFSFKLFRSCKSGVFTD